MDEYEWKRINQVRVVVVVVEEVEEVVVVLLYWTEITGYDVPVLFPFSGRGSEQ